MHKKILILGRTGMVGCTAFKVFSGINNFEVFGTVRNSSDPFYFDVDQDIGRLDEIINSNKPIDFIFNCIGIIKNHIDPSKEISVHRAIKINALFPHELVRMAKGRDIKVIHISTDCVFSGQDESYTESSANDCLDIYGKTKSLGEVVEDNALNIRCSIVGPSPFRKLGLLEWFLSCPDHSTVNGFTNHYWNGVTTYQLAHLLKQIVESDIFESLRRETHLFHYCPNETVTKYELLKTFQTVYQKKINIIPMEESGGPIKRILKTCHMGLANMIGKHESRMLDVVMEMKRYWERDFISAAL